MYSDKGDFLINEKYVFEIWKDKVRNKLKVLKTLSPQTILSMALNKIPLWLFDFVLIDGFWF
jgi:hypothetical protein